MGEVLKLRQLVADETRVWTTVPPEYQSDTLGRLQGDARAVLFPISSEEVSNIMKWAYAHNVPVTARGAGTNLVGSTVPAKGALVLDLHLMNQILELDEETMTATVMAGTVLQDFQAYVEARGWFYPPDPGEKLATLGGNISTNAGGMRAVKYGVTRDYVRALEVVLADGTILQLGSKNIKDSSGLALKQLLIGAEGTLGIITKATLKLVPKPETMFTVVVPFASLSEGIQCVLKVLRENAHPTAVEFVERKVIRLGEDFLHLQFPYPQADAYILLSFDGTVDEVEENSRRLEKVVLQNRALDYIRLDNPEELQTVWKIRGALVKAVEHVSEQEPIDIVVPINQTARFIQFVNGLEEETGVQMVSFGHAGDGNVHLCVVRGKRSDAEWEEALDLVMPKLYEKAYALGGLTSGEHGIGLAKKPYFLTHTPKENLALMRQIKKAWDPKEILNPGQSYLAKE